MNSSRERKPAGMTNISGRGERSPPVSQRSSARSLDTARIKELNDPLSVHRPYTPEIKQEALDRPPALPQSRYPTVTEPRQFQQSGVIT